MRGSLASLLTGVVLSAACASAATIPITNSGFETDRIPTGSGNGDNTGAGNYLYPKLPTGWSGGGGVTFIQTFDSTIQSDSPVTDGTNWMGINGGTNIVVYQQLSTNWAPSTTYTLSIGLGNRVGGAGDTDAVAIFGLSTDATVAHIQGTAGSVDTSNTALIPATSWATFNCLQQPIHLCAAS